MLKFEHVKSFFKNHKISVRIVVLCFVLSFVLSALILELNKRAAYLLNIEVTDATLRADIDVITALIDRLHRENRWSAKDDGLYRGKEWLGGIQKPNTDSALYDWYYTRVNESFMVTQLCPEKCADPKNCQDLNCRPGQFIVVGGDEFYHDLLGTPIAPDIAKELLEKGVARAFQDYRGDRGYTVYQALRDENQKIVGAFVGVTDYQIMSQNVRVAQDHIFWSVLLLIFISGFIISYLSFRWTRSLENMKTRIQAVSTNAISSHHLSAKKSDIYRTLSDIETSLQDKKRMEAELAFANLLQLNMLPNDFPVFPDYPEVDIYATMTPAKEVGGDFYDMFMPDQEHVAVVIGDVSGKGMPAALFMVSVKTLIQNSVEQNQSLDQMFEKVNNTLCAVNKLGMFVTVWFGLLELATGQLRYINAGHNPPLLLDTNGTAQWLKQRSGFVLAGKRNMKYKTFDLTMSPGQKLLLYTDGVTEAKTAQKAMFGDQRLLDYMTEHVTDGLQKTLAGIKNTVKDFVGDAEQFDDMTMLMLSYQGPVEKTLATQTFAASLDELNRVKDYARTVFSKTTCQANFIFKILLVVEEIFVNIVSYAYDEPGGEISFGMYADQKLVKLQFKDSGRPFDPLTQQNPDITLPAKQRTAGGLGIFMTKKIMDTIDYAYVDGQNVLTMTKSF